MPALRSLAVVHSTLGRLDPQGRSCCTRLVPSFLSRFLSMDASSDAIFRQDVMHPACVDHDSPVLVSECKQHAAESSHSHASACASASLIMNGEHASAHAAPQPVKLTGSQQQNACILDADPHACIANDSTFAPALEGEGKKTRASCKRHQALELLHRKVSVLECEQVSPADAIIIKKSNAFKSTSLAHLAAVLKVLKEFLGSGEKACRVLALNRRILLEQSESLAQTLPILADFGSREAIVSKLCTSGSLLPLKVESVCKALKLLKEICPTLKMRNRIWHRYPQIVRTSEVSISQVLQFLTSSGMSWKGIQLSLQQQPALLGYPIGPMTKRYTFFRQLGCTADEIMRATRAGLPLVATRTYQEKIKLLKDEGFSDQDVRVTLSHYPSIFSLSCECLKSKLDYLLCEQNYDITDITRCPLCLTYSLQDRIIPRIKAAKEMGLLKVYALSTILAYNEQRFQKLKGSSSQRR